MQRVFFPPVSVSSRIPSNAYDTCGKKRSRGPAEWRGKLERFERRFCDSCSRRLPVRRLVSTHRVKRWSTANARRQHIPVLPNGPPRTSSLLWIVVSRVGTPSIETCTLFQRRTKCCISWVYIRVIVVNSLPVRQTLGSMRQFER